MKWHVFTTVGPKDRFVRPPIDRGDKILQIAIDHAGNPREISTHIWKVIDSHGLSVSRLGVDLSRIAMAAYTADTRIPRATAFDGWSRDIVLHVPVSDPQKWLQCKETIENLLGFLSGDHWVFIPRHSDFFRPLEDEKLRRKAKRLKAKTLSLFSGGLDSFIGAVDLLAQSHKTVFVGHYNEGTTSKPQSETFAAIQKKFGVLEPVLLQFYVRPPTGEVESTTRSRSFLFFALACLAASGLGDGVQIVIPENGFIGLNVPLTYSRLGSLSTRTTHPYTISLFRQLIEILDLPFTITLPYRFFTKGEMLKNSKDITFVKSSLSLTMSCAHPAANRYSKQNPNIHCGYCLPCIIRRAAMNKVGLRGESYAFNILNETLSRTRSSDLNAFLVAIARSPVSDRSNILRSGPLPVLSEEIKRYSDMYRRGFKEVADFLSKRAIR